MCDQPSWVGRWWWIYLTFGRYSISCKGFMWSTLVSLWWILHWLTFNLLQGIDLHDLHFWVYDGFYLGRYSISCKGIYVIYPLWVYDGLTLGWYLVSFARDLHDQPWWAYYGFFDNFFATWQQEKNSSSTHTKEFFFNYYF